MAEPADMILPLLRDIRADIAASDVKADRRNELLIASIEKFERRMNATEQH